MVMAPAEHASSAPSRMKTCASASAPPRVGIVGYGALGQFLCEKIDEHNVAAGTSSAGAKRIEIGWVWNRTKEKIPADRYRVLPELEDYLDRASGADSELSVDLVVEVAHPAISEKYGARFLALADYYMGSPTAMANQSLNNELQAIAKNAAVKGSLYLPVGALWGAVDLQRMADLGTLQGLTVAMKKHPSSLKLTPPLSDKLQDLDFLKPDTENILFEGPVRELCPLAPNNVNTMACAAIAAHNLGFDKTKAKLVADDRLTKEHVIEINVLGPNGFHVDTARVNPAAVGAVTGAQTYLSFFSSLRKACSMGEGGSAAGVFFC
eukprot:g2705.t1